MLWGRPLLPWQRNLGKFGLFFDKIAHESSLCQIDQICLGLEAETTSGADLCWQGNDIWDRRGVYSPAGLYVCMYVCNSPLNRFFFFVSPWNRAISWPSVLHVKSYKTLFFEFWFVAMATIFGLFLKKFQIASFCFSIESSHFLAISSPWPPLQNVVLWFLI